LRYHCFYSYTVDGGFAAKKWFCSLGLKSEVARRNIQWIENVKLGLEMAFALPQYLSVASDLSPRLPFAADVM
jgi:hypothetical protein